MMAMMLVASATAFAGDSDALKAILKVPRRLRPTTNW